MDFHNHLRWRRNLLRTTLIFLIRKKMGQQTTANQGHQLCLLTVMVEVLTGLWWAAINWALPVIYASRHLLAAVHWTFIIVVIQKSVLTNAKCAIDHLPPKGTWSNTCWHTKYATFPIPSAIIATAAKIQKTRTILMIQQQKRKKSRTNPPLKRLLRSQRPMARRDKSALPPLSAPQEVTPQIMGEACQTDPKIPHRSYEEHHWSTNAKFARKVSAAQVPCRFISERTQVTNPSNAQFAEKLSQQKGTWRSIWELICGTTAHLAEDAECRSNPHLWWHTKRTLLCKQGSHHGLRISFSTSSRRLWTEFHPTRWTRYRWSRVSPVAWRTCPYPWTLTTWPRPEPRFRNTN